MDVVDVALIACAQNVQAVGIDDPGISDAAEGDAAGVQVQLIVGNARALADAVGGDVVHAGDVVARAERVAAQVGIDARHTVVVIARLAGGGDGLRLRAADARLVRHGNVLIEKVDRDWIKAFAGHFGVGQVALGGHGIV